MKPTLNGITARTFFGEPYDLASRLEAEILPPEGVAHRCRECTRRKGEILFVAFPGMSAPPREECHGRLLLVAAGKGLACGRLERDSEGRLWLTASSRCPAPWRVPFLLGWVPIAVIVGERREP